MLQLIEGVSFLFSAFVVCCLLLEEGKEFQKAYYASHDRSAWHAHAGSGCYYYFSANQHYKSKGQKKRRVNKQTAKKEILDYRKSLWKWGPYRIMQQMIAKRGKKSV